MTKLLLAMIAALVMAVMLWRVGVGNRTGEKVYEPPSHKVDVASPCPWRYAEQDLTNWFPGATGYEISDLILSGQRLQVQERLGRPMLPEEMALHLYVPVSNQVRLGTVLTRRLKGPHGAIEIAVGVDMNNVVQSFRIQRSREPREVVAALAEMKLEERFRGTSARDQFSDAKLGDAAPEAKDCAREIGLAVRTLLMLLEAGDNEARRSHH